jgi:hypothetical protein
MFIPKGTLTLSGLVVEKLKKESQAWWCTPVIPAIWEMEARVSHNSVRPKVQDPISK